jgi:hypothetical protein
VYCSNKDMCIDIIKANIHHSVYFALIFKRKLKLKYVQFLRPPTYHFTGNRKLNILHARLRQKCSSLRSDLFRNSLQRHVYCSNKDMCIDIIKANIHHSVYFALLLCIVRFTMMTFISTFMCLLSNIFIMSN